MKKTAKPKIPTLPTAMHLRELAELVKRPPDLRRCPPWLHALCQFFGCCETPPPPKVPFPRTVTTRVGG